MAVYFKCSACKSEHRSMAVRMDKASFEGGNHIEMSEPCPITKKMVKWTNRDLRWKDET